MWRRTSAIAVAIAQLALSAAIAPPASAVPSCGFVNGVLTITDDAAVGFDQIDVWQDSSARVWASVASVLPPGPPTPGDLCDGGPVPLTALRSITVTAASANDSLVIWMSQGPGISTSLPQSTGSAAADWGTVDWTVDLGGGLNGLLVADSPATEGLTLSAGDAGMDLNGDDNLDVTYARVSALSVFVTRTAPGESSINFGGGAATGGPVTIPTLILVAGPSNDKITGGTGDDVIAGGPGNDRVSGGAGSDSISGDAGNDKLSGGPGPDLVRGGRGRDVCSGGPGSDRVRCEVGRASG